MPDQTKKEDILTEYMSDFRVEKRTTKQSAVRLTIAKAIRHGVYEPGDYLPPEQKLTALLGVSLGTVQKALAQLQQAFLITRKRREGTKVMSPETRNKQSWHFKFIHRKTNQWLSRIDEKIEIGESRDDGVWTEFMGNLDSVIVIRRLTIFDTPEKLPFPIKIGAELFVKPELVQGILDVEPSEFRMLNLRMGLGERFAFRVTHATHKLCLSYPTKVDCKHFGFPSSEPMLEINACSFLPDESPAYFQRILAPADQCAVQL